MDLDEKQQYTHSVKTLVECADIVRAELQKHPFTEEQAEQMVLIYWRALVTQTFTPDLNSIIKEMFKQDE